MEMKSTLSFLTIFPFRCYLFELHHCTILGVSEYYQFILLILETQQQSTIFSIIDLIIIITLLRESKNFAHFLLNIWLRNEVED